MNVVTHGPQVWRKEQSVLLCVESYIDVVGHGEAEIAKFHLEFLARKGCMYGYIVPPDYSMYGDCVVVNMKLINGLDPHAA